MLRMIHRIQYDIMQLKLNCYLDILIKKDSVPKSKVYLAFYFPKHNLNRFISFVHRNKWNALCSDIHKDEARHEETMVICNSLKLWYLWDLRQTVAEAQFDDFITFFRVSFSNRYKIQSVSQIDWTYGKWRAKWLRNGDE